LRALGERDEQATGLEVEVPAEIEAAEGDLLLRSIALFARRKEGRAGPDRLLADRTGGVRAPVEAVAADHVPAGIEHVRAVDLSAEDAGLLLALEIVDEHLLPPQRLGVARQALGEAGEQRHVRLTAAHVGQKGCGRCPDERCELVDRRRREPCAQPGRQDIAERGQLELGAAHDIVGVRGARG